MAEILKVYSPEQLKTFVRDYAVTKSDGRLSDWNFQSPNAVLTDGFCQVTALVASSFYKGLQLATPVGLYVALKFERKDAQQATGLFRFYRVPEITFRYAGTGTSCLLTITANTLTTTVTGGPGGEDLNVDLVPIANTSNLASILNSSPYTAALNGPGASAPSLLYDYLSVEMVGATNHRNDPGFPIMLEAAAPVSVPTDLILVRGTVNYRTLSAGTIAAGASSSEQLAAIATETGEAGNMSALGIDTLNGFGSMVSIPTGVEHAINDSAFANGDVQESADARALRFKDRIQGLNSGTYYGLLTNVAALDGIRGASIRPFYPRPGFVTIVADDGTGTLSPELIASIRLLLDGNPNNLAENPGIGTAGITYNIEAPVIQVVPIAITVQRVSSLSDATDITTTVITAVENYVNTLGLGGDVIPSEIITATQNAHPAIFQVILTDPTTQVSVDFTSSARTGTAVGSPVVVSLTTLTEAP